MHAKLIYLIAKTDRDIERGRGHLTMFIIEPDMPGFERRRMNAMGQKSDGLAELFFADMRVPKTAVLGEEGNAFSASLLQFFNHDRVILAVRALATAQLTFALTVEYVKGRQAFSRRVFDFQNTQFKLAAIKAELIVGQGFRDALLRKVIDGTLDATTASAAKLWTSELLYRTAHECLQLHGGFGYMNESPISRIFTYARLQPLYAGTSEIQKGIIARSI
jgi:acyl-CoA dehydrogenase